MPLQCGIFEMARSWHPVPQRNGPDGSALRQSFKPRSRNSFIVFHLMLVVEPSTTYLEWRSHITMLLLRLEVERAVFSWVSFPCLMMHRLRSSLYPCCSAKRSSLWLSRVFGTYHNPRFADLHLSEFKGFASHSVVVALQDATRPSLYQLLINGQVNLITPWPVAPHAAQNSHWFPFRQLYRMSG